MKLQEMLDRRNNPAPVAPSPPREAPEAERMCNNAPRTFTEADFPVGSVSHQGDLIFVRIDSLPENRRTRTETQLAIGDTQGSRHVLQDHAGLWDAEHPEELLDKVRAVVPQLHTDVPSECVGPVFFGGTATHPEHGHQTFPKDACIATIYQVHLDNAGELRRVAD